MPDLSRVIASLLQARMKLDLGTADLCFLVALHARAEQDALAHFDEERLVDEFVRICDVTDPGAENPRKRATHAIQRMRDARLLARVDGAGMVRSGEYAMTALGGAIAQFLCADEALTRESLALLTKNIVTELASAKQAAGRAANPDDWRLGVVGPLRHTVADLVHGIERRQRGLDAQQSDVRDQIEALIQKDWFGAVDACERLLDDTARTLGELNEVLVADGGHLQALLGEIEEDGRDRGAPEAEAAAQQVSLQLDRVLAWGSARQRAWSEYYQSVQRYLRDVVRMDPNRAVSQRLRDQLSSWLDSPFALRSADEPSIRLMRDVSRAVQRPPARRPRADRERPVENVGPDGTPTIEEQVMAALATGPARLSELLAAVLPGVDERERYRAAGRIAALAAAELRVSAPHEREWVTIPGSLHIEEWSLERRTR
jgi:chromosome partition protein MukF